MSVVQSRLSQEEVREILARAEEIQLRTAPDGSLQSEAEIVILAAEEAGLSRAAVEEALRERFDLLAKPPEAGELVFAKSIDGYFSVAEVVEVAGSKTRVKYLQGSEHTVLFEDLRPLSLIPGAKVLCPWPNWGWWNCTVISYDSEKQRIKVTDGWGSTETFALADIALERPRTRRESLLARSKAFLYAALVAGGGLVGAALTWLAMR